MRVALEGVPGVKKATVDFLRAGRAEVRYEKGKVSLEQLTKALESKGYGVVLIEGVTLKIEEGCDVACASKLDSFILKIPGVRDIYPDLDNQADLRVEWVKGKLTSKEVLNLLEEIFRVQVLGEGKFAISGLKKETAVEGGLTGRIFLRVNYLGIDRFRIVRNALEGVPGVREAIIDYGRAEVRYEKGKVSLEQLIKALADEGFSGYELEVLTLRIEGEECDADCREKVKTFLVKIPGVKGVYTDLDHEEALGVEWEKGKFTPKEILRALEEKGFKVKVLDEGISHGN